MHIHRRTERCHGNASFEEILNHRISAIVNSRMRPRRPDQEMHSWNQITIERTRGCQATKGRLSELEMVPDAHRVDRARVWCSELAGILQACFNRYDCRADSMTTDDWMHRSRTRRENCPDIRHPCIGIYSKSVLCVRCVLEPHGQGIYQKSMCF